MKILITGATGFVGKALLTKLLSNKRYTPTIAVRHFIEQCKDIQQIIINDLNDKVDWSEGITGIDVVVHMAGRAHVLKETEKNPLEAFRAINVAATLNLAKQALEAGVKRFIFVSSIGVNGIHNDQPFTEQDTPNPQTDYARSKLEAEEALWRLTANTSMELVIIRPPLVYGEGVKANFLSLINWVNKGLPLPLGLVKNKRSFVGVDNLVDLLITVLAHPQAANELFLVADGQDISTPQLLKLTAKELHKAFYLLPVPVSFLRLAASLLGKKNVAIQLCDSLQVDITKANKLLDWKPPILLEEGIRKTVYPFLRDRDK